MKGHRSQPSAVSTVEIVRCIYDAYESGDARTPAGYFRDDVEGYISDFVPWGGHRKGKVDVREGLQVLREYVSTAFEPDEIIDAGSHVVAIGHTVGLLQQTGQPFSIRTVHVWRFEDGKVVRFENYLDKGFAAILKAIA